MENNNDTNIINDDDFLKDIFSGMQNTPPVNPVVDNSDIDKILLGNEIPGDNTPPTNEPPKEEGAAEPEKETVERTEEEIAAEEKAARQSRFGVRDTISSLIENDVWVDMPIKYNDKEYENIADLLEKEKPSKELFDLLSVAQKNHRESQIKENYVKVGDKDSIKAKLVNAILDDADYRELLDYNKEVIEPLQKIDFANIQNGKEIAEAFVRQCLVEIDNYHPDSIDAVVAKLNADFRLIEKAEEYQKVTIDKFNEEIEKRRNDKLEIERVQAENLKKDVKALKEELKTQGVDEKFANQILKLRFTKDEGGKFHYEKHILDKIQNDKTFEARLMHFLLNEDDFIAKANSKVKQDTSKKYLELISVTPKEGGAQATKPKSTNLQIDDEDLFAELGLI